VKMADVSKFVKMATLSARKYDRLLQGNMIRRRGLEVALGGWDS